MGEFFNPNGIVVYSNTKITLKCHIRTTAVHNKNLVESILEVILRSNFRAKDGRNYIVQEGRGIFSLGDVV